MRSDQGLFEYSEFEIISDINIQMDTNYIHKIRIKFSIFLPILIRVSNNITYLVTYTSWWWNIKLSLHLCLLTKRKCSGEFQSIYMYFECACICVWFTFFFCSQFFFTLNNNGHKLVQQKYSCFLNKIK